VLKKRGIIAHDTMRKPAPRLSPETIAEVDWLMARIEKHSTRTEKRDIAA